MEENRIEDKNLRQFPEKTLTIPWGLFMIFSLCFCAISSAPMVHAWTNNSAIPNYSLIAATICGALAVFFFLLTIFCGDIKVPRLEHDQRDAFLLLTASGLHQIADMRISKDNSRLIYLADSMTLTVTFRDLVGVMHEFKFRVKFTPKDLITAHFIEFYRWYHGLLKLQCSAELFRDQLLDAGEQNSPLPFRIVFPLNQQVPAIANA